MPPAASLYLLRLNAALPANIASHCAGGAMALLALALAAQACRDCCSERVPPAQAIPAAHSSRKHGDACADVPWRCRPDGEFFHSLAF